MPPRARAAASGRGQLVPVHEPRTLKGGPLANHPYRDESHMPEARQVRRRFRRRFSPGQVPRPVPLALELRLLFRRETLTGLAIIAVGLVGIAVLSWLSPLVLLLLPIFGLAETITGIHRGLRLARLLAVARTARARVVDTRPHSSDDRDTRYATIEFEVDGVTIRREHRLRSSETLEGRATTAVFYDPADPETHCIAVDLPGRPRLDAAGALQYERR